MIAKAYFIKIFYLRSPFNIFKSYVIRYIRLTTALVPVVLVTIGPLRYIDSGPEWTARTSQIVGFCEKYWWSALLHVQNYVNPFEVVRLVKTFPLLAFELYQIFTSFVKVCGTSLVFVCRFSTLSHLTINFVSFMEIW